MPTKKKPYAIRLSALIAILSLFACDKAVEEDPFRPASAEVIYGLGSPIVTGVDSTVLVLQDYFNDPTSVDSIAPAAGLKLVERTADDRLILTGQMTDPIGNFRFYLGNLTVDVPSFKNKRVRYTLRVADPDRKYEAMSVAGSMNGWVNNSDSLVYDEGEWKIDFILNPGKHTYRLWIDGEEQTDPTHERIASNGFGGYNSFFVIDEPQGDDPWARMELDTAGRLTVTSHGRTLCYWENHLIAENWSDTSFTLDIPKAADSLGRTHIRVYTFDHAEKGQDHLIPLENGQVISSTASLTRSDKHAYVMYFMMVDRFNDAIAENNKPVDNDSIAPLANFMGGDIAGVTAKIEEGYFTALGVNTVWLSPIGTNPQGAWGLWDKGGVVSKFSGYHGYWPAESRSIDKRFGTADDLDALIDKAHDRDMNVLLDYVANHVHKNHPVIAQHPDWVTPLYLPDGRMNTELWDEQRLTTWFDTFLPTLDLENPVVADAMSDSALYWFESFAIDGFRHDATKHIPNNFWRLLYKKLKQRIIVPQGRSIYQIGETYGSPELINSYISSGMLDAQFDFNFYDAAIAAIGNPDESMERLSATMQMGLSTYGSHHLMGNISGNQDRPRFISLADGSVRWDEDAKLAGWTRDIEAQGSVGYERLALLHALNMTSPGIPVIYYGDEYGMVGANDPDNRRMMKFDDFDDLEIATLAKVKSLISLRRSSMALNYGNTHVLYSDDEAIVYLRNYFDRWVLVGINAGDEQAELAFDVPTYLGLSHVPEELTIEARSYRIEKN